MGNKPSLGLMSKATLTSTSQEACPSQPVLCTYLTDEFTLGAMLQSCDRILLWFFDCVKLRNAGPKIGVVLPYLLCGGILLVCNTDLLLGL